MSKFKVGDVVRLKSGGPDMTVRTPEAVQGVYCEWFVGLNVKKLKGEAFKAETIELVPVPPPKRL